MFASTRLCLRQQLPGIANRSLSTTVALGKHPIPTIADITAQGPAAFQEKLANFRETQKKPFPRPASEMRTPKAANDPNSAAGAAGAAAASDHVSKGGIVKSILYGSEKGKREEAEMEQSYSKVLARGKYVHAIEFHHVKPDQHARYVEMIGNEYPSIAGDSGNKCHLVGSWKTEIGDPDLFVHIWEYHGYAGYHSTRNRLNQMPGHIKFHNELPQVLTSRRTDLMQEFSFWPTCPPRSLGGIFELRSYTLKPGNLLEWETHWRTGLPARRKVMEGVGAWFIQIGELNKVHYLWQYADLRERQTGREKSWGEKGWSETVHKTVPLIQRMESRIMVPLPWSPVS